MGYIAKRNNLVTGLMSNTLLEKCFSERRDIYRQDENGDTLIATQGEWLEEKPNIENHGEYVPLDISAQVKQNSADLAYISMMTGVDL